MAASQQIRYLQHAEIDKGKWDSCIATAANGLLYARSFFLNAMAGSWDALVLNDYQQVMPLTWKKKYGFYYLYQPYFVPFLGVFGTGLNNATTVDFLHAIPKKFIYWDIDLNEFNSVPPQHASSKLSLKNRTNFHLALNRTYDDIYDNYSKACRRRLRKFTGEQIQITTGETVGDAIQFYVKHYGDKYPKIMPTVYRNLELAASTGQKNGLTKLYFAKTAAGDTLGAYLVFVDERNVYLLIGGSSETGKQNGAFYLLTDQIIRDHAGTERILRFEGSDIPGIADFNRQFSSIARSYIRVRFNNLPFPLNLLKRS